MSYYGSANNNSSGGFYGGGGDFGQNNTYSNEQQQQQQGGWQQQPQQPPQAQQPQQPSFVAQQWQPHAQQQQQQQYPNNPAYPTQQTAMPPFWNPATTAATMAAVAGGNTDAAIDLVSTAGKTFLHSGTARMIPGLTSAMQTLRAYFAVNNVYVLKKLQKVLFPFLSKNWKRSELYSTSSGKYAPQSHQMNPYITNNIAVSTQYNLPRLDENAPDLYLPFMSLVTYVLLCALLYGTAGQFEFQVIPSVCAKCFFTQILEVLLLRLGMYTMQVVHSMPLLDLLCYTGYKYVGLCINMIISLILGHLVGLGTIRAYYISFLWTASAVSFFMLKVMANNIPMVTASTGPKREIMILVFAVGQFASMWFVSQTKFL